jgi:hypothetical protein
MKVEYKFNTRSNHRLRLKAKIEQIPVKSIQKNAIFEQREIFHQREILDIN